MRSFDQGRYWAKRGDRYREEFARHTPDTAAVFREQEAQVAALLGRHDFGGVTSLLEIGCGFGRLTPLLLAHLPNLERYVGLDVSPRQVAAARQAFPGGVDAEFLAADFRTAKLAGPFGLVFAGEVFLHFPPSEIEGVVAKALGLGAALVHLDPFRPRPKETRRADVLRLLDRLRRRAPLGSTDWTHDYPRFYVDRTVTIHPVLNGMQHLFVVE